MFSRYAGTSLRFRVAIVCLVMIFGACTSRSVCVKPSDYNVVDASEAERWRVVTKDDYTYWVDSFHMTDSTLIIIQASRLYKGPNAAEPVYLTSEDLPIVVSRDELARLDKRVISWGPTTLLLILGIGLVVGYAALSAYGAGYAGGR